MAVTGDIALLLNNSYASENTTKNVTSQQEYYLYDTFALENATIYNKVIVLQSASLFLSDTIIMSTKIKMNGTRDYSVFMDNCSFEDSEIIIHSATNVRIMNGIFKTQKKPQDQLSNHILSILNSYSLYIHYTSFGNEINTTLDRAHLGIKLEQVEHGEIRHSTFTGIRSNVSDGVVLFLKSSEIEIISCRFQFNLAKSGIIYASDSSNITSIKSSYISNEAEISGAVFYLKNFCTLTNYDCQFHSNMATYGTIFAKDYVNIKNIDISCISNYAEKSGGVLYLKNFCTLLNDGCTFQNNTANDGGVIYAVYSVTNENHRCLFHYNMGLECGSVVTLWHDGQIINKQVNSRIKCHCMNG